MPKDLSRIKMNFTLAVGVATDIGMPNGKAQDAEIQVMFIAAPYRSAQAQRDIAKMAIEKNKDVVLLEFEKGKERHGPRNIIVFERGENGLQTWKECSLWSQTKGGLAVILPAGSEFAFVHNGNDLVRVVDAPTTGLHRGFLAAKRHLAEMVKRIPDELVDQYENQSQLH